VQELKSGSARSTTTYGYDANSNLTSWFADDQVAPQTDQYSAYSYDARDLLESVKTGTSPADSALKTTTYTYTARGERADITKPNGNKTTYRWIEDGLMRSLDEKQGNTLISSHSLAYDLDGHRTSDVSKVKSADSAAYLDQTAQLVYETDGRLQSTTKTGTNPGPRERYWYDAAGNVTQQAQGSKTTYYSFDRNRLQCAGTDSTDACGPGSLAYNYDAFGRLNTVTGDDKTVERYGYDGYDRVVSHRKYDPATGTPKSSKTTMFDPLDRTVSDTTTIGAGTPKTVNYAYVGLTDQVISEEQAVSGTDKSLAQYTYGPTGERISQTKTPTSGGADETNYYGLNPHTDVETLTSDTGAVTSTYRYTAYGNNDTTGFTGKDKPSATGDPAVEPYNPYRFNSKRWDPATSSYDMGFRDYSPGLNRFLTRDMYSGALADLRLGTDPWNTNRYAFAGGNPITGIELDGHMNKEESYGGGQPPPPLDHEGQVGITQQANTSGSPVETTKPSLSEKFVQRFGGNTTQKVGNELFVKPVEETVDACKAAFQMENYATTWQQCKTGVALTALSFTGAGKVVGIGVRTAEGLAAAEAEGAWAGTLARTTAKTACFVAGTQILLGDGTKKSIEDVKAGDKVASYNPDTGKQETKTVKRTFVHLDVPTFDVTVDGEIVTTTEEHPFWVIGKGWTPVQDLKVGDQLREPDGATVAVQAVRATGKTATVYNFEVEDTHNYYVLAGNTPVLVHNICNLPIGPGSEKAWTVLNRIDAKGAPLPGYKGGSVFKNSQGRLPEIDGVTYREWDVNPYVKGVNRGAERLVTGSDGSAYFTGDHYDTFLMFRGPTG
jgi:RHS repeat-associated protein